MMGIFWKMDPRPIQCQLSPYVASWLTNLLLLFFIFTCIVCYVHDRLSRHYPVRQQYVSLDAQSLYFYVDSQSSLGLELGMGKYIQSVAFDTLVLVVAKITSSDKVTLWITIPRQHIIETRRHKKYTQHLHGVLDWTEYISRRRGRWTQSTELKMAQGSSRICAHFSDNYSYT